MISNLPKRLSKLLRRSIRGKSLQHGSRVRRSQRSGQLRQRLWAASEEGYGHVALAARGEDAGDACACGRSGSEDDGEACELPEERERERELISFVLFIFFQSIFILFERREDISIQ